MIFVSNLMAFTVIFKTTCSRNCDYLQESVDIKRQIFYIEVSMSNEDTNVSKPVNKCEFLKKKTVAFSVLPKSIVTFQT